MNKPTDTTKPITIADRRQSFYDGAQYLYDVHFTTCHPFPAREVMDAATRRYPDSKEFRTVTINGTKYRVNDGVIEVKVSSDWSRVVAITPGYVKALADLIDHPYEVSK